MDSFNSVHFFPSLAVNDSGKAFVAWLDSREDPWFGEDFRTLVAWGAPNSVKGDLNLDSLLTAVDVVLALNAVFLGQSFPASFETADVNCDGKLTPTDAVIELRLVFLNESPGC
ncbi:MAG: dockerin type I domain-containing protein [Candidatus Zixiibacteriota bacterium]